jgi:hypothetical protein
MWVNHYLYHGCTFSALQETDNDFIAFKCFLCFLLALTALLQDDRRHVYVWALWDYDESEMKGVFVSSSSPRSQDMVKGWSHIGATFAFHFNVLSIFWGHRELFYLTASSCYLQLPKLDPIPLILIISLYENLQVARLTGKKTTANSSSEISKTHPCIEC